MDASKLSFARSANELFAEREGVAVPDHPPPLISSPLTSSSAGTQTPPPGKRTLTRFATGPPAVDSFLTRSCTRTLAPCGIVVGTPVSDTVTFGGASTAVNASRFSRGTSRTQSCACAARRVLGARTSNGTYPDSTPDSVHASPRIFIRPGVVGVHVSRTVLVSLGASVTFCPYATIFCPGEEECSATSSSDSHTSRVSVTFTSTLSGLVILTSTPMVSPAAHTPR